MEEDNKQPIEREITKGLTLNALEIGSEQQSIPITNTSKPSGEPINFSEGVKISTNDFNCELLSSTLDCIRLSELIVWLHQQLQQTNERRNYIG